MRETLKKIKQETGKQAEAEQIYRDIMRHCENYKVVYEARQGLRRIQKQQQNQFEAQLQLPLIQEINKTGAKELGVLVLEAIDPEEKKVAAAKLAKIMGLDNYSASLQLPTRSWRLYRTGDLEVLRLYTSSLQNASIPCFSSSVKEINELNVYQVKYFESIEPEITVFCQDKTDCVGKFTFDWSEVKNIVEGAIPMFEEITEKTIRGKTKTKTKVLDYAQFCDLHLPNRKAILRLSGPNYEFNQGFDLRGDSGPKDTPETLKENWHKLTTFLHNKVGNVKVWSDFNKFGEMALDFRLMLQHIRPNIKLMRVEPTPWDPAFQLYSGLVFLNYSC